MPRTAEAHAATREERREAILAAAARVFARQGLAGAKVADIAAEAGMSLGLLYRYYDGKDQLFAAIARKAMEGSAEIARAALAGEGTAWERLAAFVGAMLPYQFEQPECSLVVLHALTSAAVPPDVRADVLAANAAMFVAICDLLARGQAEGNVRAGDPYRMTYVFLSAIYGLAASTAFIVEGAEVPLPDAEDVLATLRAPAAGR